MLINSGASLMSLTLSAGQTRLIRAPLASPVHLRPLPTPWAVLTWRLPCHWQGWEVSFTPQSQPLSSSGRPPPAPPSTQLRVYYMTSPVNQGSINAKCTAGLTYQTQLLILNTRPRQQMGQEQRKLMRHCVQGVHSLYMACAYRASLV